MLSKDEQILGNPLSIFLYGIGILPLIQKLEEKQIDSIQPWFADDAAALGEWFCLILLYEDLLLYRPDFRYFLNLAKYMVVIHPSHEVAANNFFNTQRRMGLEICTGTRYLGG